MSALDLEQIDGVPIAHVNEDIDVANAASIHRQLADALGPDALSLVVDLSATHYVDSAGVDMLLRLSDLLDHRRATLILVIPDTSQLKRLAMVVGLPEAIAVRPSLTDAVDEAAREQVRTTASSPDSSQGQPRGEQRPIDAPAKRSAGGGQRASLSDHRGDERSPG